MSKGISKQQQRIIELISIPGSPAGLPRGILQAQLWPDLFCTDYRQTAESARVVKEKAKCRVILSRALASLIKRGLVEEGRFERFHAKEVHGRGLVLPYSLQSMHSPGLPHNGSDLGYAIIVKPQS